MNKRRSHILWLLAGLSLLAGAGCAVEVPDKDTPETAITFDPVLYATTKASAGEYPEELPFGVSAWEYDAGETWFGEKATPFLVNSIVTEREDAVWAPDPEVLWPDRRQRLTFVAYAPYGAADYIDPVNGVTFASVDVTRDQTDLLYTEPATDLTVYTSGGMVSLAFHHALCSLSFSLRTSDDDVYDHVSVLSLSLEKIACVGTFRSLPAPGWTTEGNDGKLTFFQGQQPLDGESRAVGKPLWVIPQFAVARVVVRILLENTFIGTREESFVSAPLGIPLEPGRNYTFSLTCNPEFRSLKVDQLEKQQ